MNRGLTGLACMVWLFACVGTPQAAHATKQERVSGVFSSPVGTLNVSEKKGVLIARAATSKGPCAFKKGTVVFRGERLDDSFTGDFKLCKTGPASCQGTVDGFAMLLVVDEGRGLSGAVHVDKGACKTPMPADGVTMSWKRDFKRRAPKPKPEPKVATPDMRAQAEALAREGQAFAQRGMAERARDKFRAALDIWPDYAQGFVGIGVTYYMRERYAEAEKFYKLAIAIDPDTTDAYYNLGCLRALAGDKEQALRYLTIAMMNGYVEIETLSVDTDLKSLHGDPQFEALRGAPK